MSTPIRMPYDCPACGKTLYSTANSRPEPSAPRRATFLYILAGTVASLTFLVLLVALREMLKWEVDRPHGVGDSEIVIYRVPPTWLLSVVALPIALVPGIAIGWLAGRLPQVRRVRCWNCKWSATYPTAAVWDEPPAAAAAMTGSSSRGSGGFEVVADDGGDAWKEASAWALAELREGRSPEAVEADLVEQGWPADNVAGMVEQCRKAVRRKGG